MLELSPVVKYVLLYLSTLLPRDDLIYRFHVHPAGLHRFLRLFCFPSLPVGLETRNQDQHVPRLGGNSVRHKITGIDGIVTFQARSAPKNP